MKRAAIALTTLVLLLGACSEKDKDKEKEANPAASPCVQTPSPIAAPTFPAGFPPIGDVTWTASQTAGPSTVTTGYTGDALADLYNEMKEKFDGGGYKVTKSEKDPHDAEVNFQGNKSTGQVRLSEECQGRTAVVITIRPA